MTTTTRCETTREAMPALARGTLDAADAAIARSHLAGCAACAAEWRVVSTLAAMRGPAPAGLTERVSATLAQRGRRAAPRPLRWIGGAGIAVAAVVALLLAWPAERADDSTVAVAEATGSDPFLDASLFDDGAIPLDAAIDDAIEDEIGSDAAAASDAEEVLGVAPLAMDLGDPRGDWPGADGKAAGAATLNDLTYDEMELLLGEMQT